MADPVAARSLRRRSATARLLRLRVRIPPGAWRSVCCECCVFTGIGLCDELITRPEESYRLWCVWVWSWNLDNEGTMAHWGAVVPWEGGSVRWIDISVSQVRRHGISLLKLYTLNSTELRNAENDTALRRSRWKSYVFDTSVINLYIESLVVHRAIPLRTANLTRWRN